MRKFLYIFIFYFFSLNAFSGNRYWVGGSGNWNDTEHWSEQSGGKPGASVPTLHDNVIFDNRSFVNDGDVVLISGNVYCRDILWKDLVNLPVFSGSSASQLQINGSLLFAAEMTNRFFGKIIFSSNNPGNKITTNKQVFYGDVIFNGNGAWTITDNFRTGQQSSIYFLKGKLTFNNSTIICSSFISSGTEKRELYLGKSKITVRNKWEITNSDNLLLDAEKAKLILPKEKSSKTFSSPDNLKYGDIVIAMGNCIPSGAPCTGFTISLTSTPDSCNGTPCNGTATAAVSGGVGPFSYVWTPSGQTTPTATGLCAGTPLVTVSDIGSGEDCDCYISISEPPPLLASTGQQPATCNGVCDGMAWVTPSGGVAPYTYLWAPGGQTTSAATGLCGGITYTVTVTDSYGCTVVRTRAVTQPPAMVHGGSSTSISCNGVCTGTASVNPSGGTPPYTYLWSPGGQTTSGISNLCVGNYTCIITDANGCTTAYTTTITQPPALTVTVTGTNLLCNSVCTGSVTATVSGGTPGYSYLWSPGGATTSAVTGLCAGTYTLTVTDANSCTRTNTVTLTQPTALSTTTMSVSASCFGLCNGTASVNPSGGTIPYTYLWSPGGCTTSACNNLCAGNYTATITDANNCSITTTVSVTQPPALIVNPTKTDVVCPGLCNGTASAGASGGTPPYTYSWSNGATTSTITGLCAPPLHPTGVYSVTVTDANGCTGTGSVTINMPPPFVTGATVLNNVSCFGLCDGGVTASPSGGTPPYTYQWMPGGNTSLTVTGLCAGTYTFNLQDTYGCSTSSVLTITQPPTFSVSVSAVNNPLNCNGDCNGAATANVSGGTPTYTYSWTTSPVQTTPSVTGLCAGTYSLNVTDANGCTANASVTFLQPTTLSVTITSSNPSCNGASNGSACATPGGGTPAYTFNWQPGAQTTACITGQPAGIYTVTVTDANGCTITQTVTLTAPATLNANAISTNALCAGQCNGTGTASPTGGTAPFTYIWSNGATTSTATGLCSGTYSVTVTDANGCTDIDIITITQPSALTSNISSTTSSCTLCTGTATVTTTEGTSPYTFLWTPSGQTTSAAVGLCIGTYTVNVTDANGCTNMLTTSISPVVNITVTVSGNNVSCAGACDGIANANVAGGNPPYTYVWSTTPIQTNAVATGLCAGTYSVTVTDFNGCFSTSTVTFTNPPVLTTTVTSTTASCGTCNGTATAMPSGGTGSYTYTWSGFPVQTTATATGLCSGNYTVTVSDANNCTTTGTVSVGNIPAISNSPSVTLATCGASDGAICAGVSGGTFPYTYQWLPGGQTTSCITGLSAGIDTLIVSDAGGCVDTFAIAVGNISGPTVTITFTVNPTCNGDCDGSIGTSVSGGNPPFNYLWVPTGQTTTSATGLCAGNHIIQVMDAIPCTTFASVPLTDPPQMNANPVFNNVSCNGGSDGSICLFPSGGNAPYTYQWFPGGQTISCVSNLTAGTYTIVLSDALGCDDTILIPISEPTQLTVSVTSTNVSCFGYNNGTATATANGGTTLYTYLWNTTPPSSLPSVVNLGTGTYTVTVTDANGCIATASVTITEPAALTTTLSSTNVLCNGNCDGMAMLTAGGGTMPYSYFWNTTPSQTTSAATGLCVGSYVGQVTDMNGCTSSQSVTITQPTSLTANVSVIPASCNGICNGSATVSAGGGTPGYTYSWSNGSTTTSATGLCAGSHTLTVTDANGCVTTVIFTVGQPSLIQANMGVTLPKCFGGCDGTATSNPVGGVPPYTFLWNTIPNQTTATATGLCSGSYTFTLSDANGCSVNQPVTIGTPPLLIQTSGVAGATCNLCNGSISVVASGGTSPYTFVWNTTPVQTTATITGLCAGVYIDTVFDANGCISVDTIGVSNTTGPLITLSSTSVTCNGQCNGTATVATVAGDGPPFTYLWNFQSQTTQTATGLCASQSPFFVTVTDTNGCKTINFINVSEPLPIAANASVTNATCFGQCDGSILTNPTGGTGTLTYSWSSGQTTASITGQCSGNYTLTITDANNCVATFTFTIGQNIILTSSVSSTNTSCNGSCDGTASVTSGGGVAPYTYLWSPTNQTSSVATGLCPGTHTVLITDAMGCQRVDSAIITQPLLLISNATGNNPLCNTSCDGWVSASPSGGTSPYTYSWSPSGCTTSSCSGLCPGTYTLVLTDVNGCTSISTVTLTAPTAISSTDLVTNSNCSFPCDGAIDITPSGGTGTYTYSWSTTPPQTSQDVTNLCPGVYSVTITDANGCSFTDSMTVGVTTLVIAAAGNDMAFCAGEDTVLCSNSLNAVSVAWYNIPSWALVGTTSCVVVTPPAGINDFGLIATNGICSDTDTVSVNVYSLPPADAGTNVTILSTSSTVLNGTGGGTYSWSPATGLSCTNCGNPTATPSVSTTYTLWVTDANGCIAMDTVRVSVIMEVVPNDGISPNGDGINDVWTIPGIEQFPDAVVEIYNRWGELLFRSIGYKQKWDAKYNGNDLPVGTYYYVINLNSPLFKEPITGPLTILR